MSLRTKKHLAFIFPKSEAITPFNSYNYKKQ